MSLTVAGDGSGLPAKLVRRLTDGGHLALPLSHSGLKKLRWLAGFWREEWFIRMAMSRTTLRRRGELAAKSDLAKWERYIFQRYVNAAERRKRGEKVPRNLFIQEIAEEVNHNYGVPVPVVVKRIPSIRKRAQMYFRRMMKTGKVVTK